MTLTQINRAGLDADALDRVFTIGASGNSAYTFQGEGLNGTVNNPTLYLTRGKTYRFENGSGGHPIRIQSTSGASGTAYNTGVTNNAQAGTVIVEVQHDAPDVLYYQCTSHAAMNGILYITGALADGGVTTAKLATDSVTATKLADQAVDTNAIQDSAVLTSKIADGQINTLKLANDAVTTAKITDANVTADKIGTGAVTEAKIQAFAVTETKIGDQAVTLAKLPHGTSSNDGKFLRANNGADPTFETISVTSDNISEGNTKAEVVDTGAGYFVVETDGAERLRVNDNGKLSTGGETSPDVDGGGLCLNTGSSDGIFFSCKNSDIAHGRTSLDETDTLFSMRKISGDKGGVDMRGYTDSAGAEPAIRIFGVIDDGSSSSSYCPVEIRGARKNSGGNTGTSQMHGNRGVVRISNDGDVTVATFTGEGLCFGSDIETANALDDYEEGTWTPTNGDMTTFNVTSSQINARYTKIGDQVTVWINQEGGQIAWSTPQYLQGLPFSVDVPSAGTFTNNYPNAGGEALVWSGGRVYMAQSDGYNTSSYRMVFCATYRTTA